MNNHQPVDRKPFVPYAWIDEYGSASYTDDWSKQQAVLATMRCFKEMMNLYKDGENE